MRNSVGIPVKKEGGIVEVFLENYPEKYKEEFLKEFMQNFLQESLENFRFSEIVHQIVRNSQIRIVEKVIIGFSEGKSKRNKINCSREFSSTFQKKCLKELPMSFIIEFHEGNH